MQVQGSNIISAVVGGNEAIVVSWKGIPLRAESDSNPNGGIVGGCDSGGVPAYCIPAPHQNLDHVSVRKRSGSPCTCSTKDAFPVGSLLRLLVFEPRRHKPFFVRAGCRKCDTFPNNSGSGTSIKLNQMSPS